MSTCHHKDEKLFELAERFIAEKSDEKQIFYIWGHSYEFDVDNNWDRIEKLCKMLSEHSDIIPVTNSQALL